MATKYLGAKEQQILQDQIREVDKLLADPDTSKAIQSKPRMLQSYRRNKQVLEAKTPPPLNGDAERQAVAQRLARLEEAMIKGNPSLVEPMPSRREMEEHPAGSVGHSARWNEFWSKHTLAADGTTVVPAEKGYGAKWEWKDGRARFFKERMADDPDVRNLEMIRPDTREKKSFIAYRSMTFAPGASLTPEAWNEATGHQPSAQEAAVQAAENEGMATAPSPETLYAVDKLRIAQPVARMCVGKKKSGNPCGRLANEGSDYCWQHGD